MNITLQPIQCTRVITAPHTQERVELLSQAKSHGSIFAATGGVHLMSNNIFKGIVLKQRKLQIEKLTKENTLHQRQERIESSALSILELAGGNISQIKSTDLTTLVTWHQHPKVASMKKGDKLTAWMDIVSSGTPPPSFEKWTDANDSELLNAQSDVIKMAHTAIGHLEVLKKKYLVLGARMMTQEEFEKIVSNRNHFVTSTRTPHRRPRPPNLDALIPP